MRPCSSSLSSRDRRSRPPGHNAVRMVLSPMPRPNSGSGICSRVPASPWKPTLEMTPPGVVALMEFSKGTGNPTRLDRATTADAAGRLHDLRDRVAPRWIDHEVGAEALGELLPIGLRL